MGAWQGCGLAGRSRGVGAAGCDGAWRGRGLLEAWPGAGRGGAEVAVGSLAGLSFPWRQHLSCPP